MTGFCQAVLVTGAAVVRPILQNCIVRCCLMCTLSQQCMLMQPSSTCCSCGVQPKGVAARLPCNMPQFLVGSLEKTANGN